MQPRLVRVCQRNVHKYSIILERSGTIVSVYSSSLSADTSLWCCWNKSPRKAWKIINKRPKWAAALKRKWCDIYIQTHLHAGWLSTVLEKLSKDTPCTRTWLLLPSEGLSFSWTGFLKCRSPHLELLGWYVATAVHIILPPDLQETEYGLVSENVSWLELWYSGEILLW